jgi:stage II sporulation protein D
VIFRRALLASALMVTLAPPALAAHEQGSVVEISVDGDGFLELRGRRYRGPFTITATEDGVALVERVDLDTYLEGLREVPFSWEEEALKSQVVAARTYLAWTLSQGRTTTGRRVGYDICATAACQVYAGVEPWLGEDGDRWRAAVEETSGEILVYDGEPARAFYSSTTGGRTRNIEDIWPGSEPAPYLVGVESEGEESPWVEWSWDLPAYLMHRLFREAGVAEGRVQSVTTRVTEDGEGPWMVEIVSDLGTVAVDTWDLRSRLNAAATAIMPDRLPAANEEGRTYPTTVLSPQYTIRYEMRINRQPGGFFPDPHYVVEGGGWGHLIGMSQFGAQAMAENGASYAQILAHYYGDLAPVDGGDYLPDQVMVGLVIGDPSVLVGTNGVLQVTLDGIDLPVNDPGPWKFTMEQGQVVVIPPPSGWPRVPPGSPHLPI